MTFPERLCRLVQQRARLPDIAGWGLPEHSAVFACELRHAFVSDAVCGIAYRLALREHPVPSLYQAELLLELERR